MSQSPTVSYSGASFTSPIPKAPQQHYHSNNSNSNTTTTPTTTQKIKDITRTIIETSHCPPELKRGPEGWSFRDLKVQRALGEGAMSTVVQCLCNRSGMLLALKMYHKERLNSLNVRQVAREIEIHASLSHQNVIKLYAAFEDADGIYLVQEFAAGGDLYAELSRHGGYMLEAHVVKNVMAPFLDAICHLHERGILHRDIKPENILLTANGEIKVADFGLAINTMKEKPMSRVGTLDYMPPEIAALPRPGVPTAAAHHPSLTPALHAAASSPSSMKPVASSPLGQTQHPASPPPQQQQQNQVVYNGNYGLPADIWCTGVLAYELLVGGPPFEAETKEATYTRILKTEPVIPSNLSQEAKDFITLALHKDPSKRPTIEQLAVHPWLRPAVHHRSHSNGIKLSTSPLAHGLVPGIAASTIPVSTTLDHAHDTTKPVAVMCDEAASACHTCTPISASSKSKDTAESDLSSPTSSSPASSTDSKGSPASLFSILVRTPTASENPSRPRSRILSSYFKKLSGKILSSGRSGGSKSSGSISSSGTGGMEVVSSSN